MEIYFEAGRFMTRIFLCRVDEFADPGTRNVVLGEGEDELDIIIATDERNAARLM